MPTFNLIISDEPFNTREPGTAPFIETVEQGASGNISTPATEAYRRALDAVAGRCAGPAPAKKTSAQHHRVRRRFYELARLAHQASALFEHFLHTPPERTGKARDMRPRVELLTRQLREEASDALEEFIC